MSAAESEPTADVCGFAVGAHVSARLVFAAETSEDLTCAPGDVFVVLGACLRARGRGFCAARAAHLDACCIRMLSISPSISRPNFTVKLVLSAHSLGPDLIPETTCINFCMHIVTIPLQGNQFNTYALPRTAKSTLSNNHMQKIPVLFVSAMHRG